MIVQYDVMYPVNDNLVTVKTSAQGVNSLVDCNFSTRDFCGAFNRALCAQHIGYSIKQQIAAWLAEHRFNYGKFPICFIDEYLINEKGQDIICFFAVALMIEHKHKEDGERQDSVIIDTGASVNVIDTQEKHALIDKLFFYKDACNSEEN